MMHFKRPPSASFKCWKVIAIFDSARRRLICWVSLIICVDIYAQSDCPQSLFHNLLRRYENTVYNVPVHAVLRRCGNISVIHWSWNASHLAFLKFHFGTLSGTGWSNVFAVIMMGWWSLPYLSDEISHATSMYIDGWHKERWSKGLVWW